MEENHHDYEFKAEYAKSNRAACKACRETIAKDSLRLAIMVQSHMFDGKVPNWFHFACFWKRARVVSVSDVHGFDGLRWPDQKKIKDKISGGDGVVPGASTSDFTAEYAKSGRAVCRGCEEKIAKDVLRLSKKDFDGVKAKMYGPQDLWHHVDCFLEKRNDLGFGPSMSPKNLVGFGKLKAEDQQMLLEKLGKGDGKKRKTDGGGDGPKKVKTETDEEKALREQSARIWKVRDAINREVSKDALCGLLQYNEQDVPSGESKLLDRVSDCMVFGALKPCKKCGGQLAYSDSGYCCTGNLTEWTKCIAVTKTPERRAFRIPSEYTDVTSLKRYKYVKRQRLFPETASPSPKPLSGLKMAVVGKMSAPRKDVVRAATELGATVVAKVDKSVVVCVSSKVEVEKMGKAMRDARESDICVVGEDFLDAVKTPGDVSIAEMLKQHSICSWGAELPADLCNRGDAVDGIAQKSTSLKSAARIRNEEVMFTKSVPDKLKLTVKGGAAVDPDSGLEAKAHLLQDGKDPYNAVLGLVDILRGTNSYYKLQLLASDTKNRWWVFRSWGRVGTTIGGEKLETFTSRPSAVEAFCALYLDKSGNEWKDRHDFVKHPKKFYPLDIDYGDDDEVLRLDANAGKNSRLPLAVQQLVRMVFDIETMKKAMLEFEIDLKKMPLGKLSKKQIKEAYKLLNEVTKVIESRGAETLILDVSNRFYTLIPHDFGMKKIPLLDNIEIIKTKTDMLDNLLDIEIAYSLLKGGGESTGDPLDVHYDKLKTDIKPMDKSSDDYVRLVDYVRNTHAKTHNMYDLEVQEIFSAAREGEAKRFKPFKALHNRQLLWHGSRLSNMAGILSQGLRIAPPEAPVTGYMFGKGLYFADMVSKSANYCCTSKSSSVGLLLLCEVALGNMHELTAAEYVTKLPKGKHSAKGCGKTSPDSEGAYVTKSGVTIPMGEGVEDMDVKNSSLLYNEYIVYDVAQVEIKYLLKVDFKYKW